MAGRAVERNSMITHCRRLAFIYSLVLYTIVIPCISWAGFGFKIDGSLDKDAISKSYFEGEFHRILPPLEMYRQYFPPTATRDDSIFVFKYLSVIYAADSSTRRKGESYMVQLIKLMPTIELIDLYISDNIQAIFKNVKAEFLRQQEYISHFDSLGSPRRVDSSRTAGRRKPISAESSNSGKGNRKWVWWTVGSLATAAAVTGATLALMDEEEPNSKSYDVIPGGQ